MEFVFRCEVLQILVGRHLVRNVDVETETGFIGPAPRDITESVATSTYQHHWETKALDILDTLSMALNRNVETAKTVSTETISTTLEDNSFRTEAMYDVLQHRLEYINK